jgi:hypothetical protein
MAVKRYHFRIDNAAGERVAYAEVVDFSALLDVLEAEADRLGVDRSTLRIRVLQTPEDADAEECEVNPGEYRRNS